MSKRTDDETLLNCKSADPNLPPTDETTTLVAESETKPECEPTGGMKLPPPDDPRWEAALEGERLANEWEPDYAEWSEEQFCIMMAARERADRNDSAETPTQTKSTSLGNWRDPNDPGWEGAREAHERTELVESSEDFQRHVEEELTAIEELRNVHSGRLTLPSPDDPEFRRILDVERRHVQETRHIDEANYAETRYLAGFRSDDESDNPGSNPRPCGLPADDDPRWPEIIERHKKLVPLREASKKRFEQDAEHFMELRDLIDDEIDDSEE